MAADSGPEGGPAEGATEGPAERAAGAGQGPAARRFGGRRTALLALAAATMAAGTAGLFWRRGSREQPKELLIAGSSSMHEMLAALADAYAHRHAGVDIVVEKGSSLSALRALKRGAIDVAAMARDLTVPEDSLHVRNFLIARNEVRIVANQALALPSLSLAQLRAVFLGEIRNWAELGGADAPVHVYSRKTMSLSRRFLEDVLLEGLDIVATAEEVDSDAELARRLAADPLGLGYLALNYRGALAPGLQSLAIEGVAPERAAAYSGRYPLIESLYLVCAEGEGRARDFIAFAGSAQGQAIVAAHFMPVR